MNINMYLCVYMYVCKYFCVYVRIAYQCTLGEVKICMYIICTYRISVLFGKVIIPTTLTCMHMHLCVFVTCAPCVVQPL